MSRPGFLAVAAALLLVAGCGGEDVATVDSTQRCLRDAGYAAVPGPASEVLHTTGQVAVSRGSFRAAIYFFDSVAAASRDAVSLGHTLAVSGGGLAIQRGSVVIGYARRPGHGERERVEGCL